MARYVLSHKRAGISGDAGRVAGRERASTAFAELFAESADLVGGNAPVAENRREIVIFDASPTEVAAKRKQLGPGVLLEPEILHFPATSHRPGRGAVQGAPAGAGSVGAGEILDVTVRGPAGPLSDVVVTLSLRSNGAVHTLVEGTDSSGKARFEYGGLWQPVVLVAIPVAEHWSMLARNPVSGMTVEAPALPSGERVGWWHRALGISESSSSLGVGVTVGVVDTGLGPHPHLSHMKSAGAFVGGRHQDDATAGRDVDCHGTHVCGTIGARSPAGAPYPGGVAPGADVVCARVFGPGEAGANQGDIVAAIEHLSTVGEADLVNLSLGAVQRSEIEHDAIVEVLEAGTLCLCAAANSAGPVQYPAAFDETVAVSALGLQGWGPDGTLSASRSPAAKDRHGNEGLYLANFSCFGNEIDCSAPGVGIIATVPENSGLSAPYAVMDGTSMASPSACGALAGALGMSADYLSLPRDLTRSTRARAVLDEIAKDIGLAPPYQGRGIPRLQISS